MSRPTRIIVEPGALLHNIRRIKTLAPKSQIIAMVKANAYGCGIRSIAPVLDGQVDALGVACLEEALKIRALGVRTPCILFQGIFGADELQTLVSHQLACVVHQPHQLRWILETPLDKPLQVWVKVNTGMHRLGFQAQEAGDVIRALKNCPWVAEPIGLMTHMACADEPNRYENQQQIERFNQLDSTSCQMRSMANSAAIMSFPSIHFDAVRPGIMLYGVSPFANKTASELGLMPVMRFVSAVSAIYHHPKGAVIGYSGTWVAKRPSVIGIVPVGYGDGYPRHIQKNTPVWINGMEVPVVGRVSMDMLSVDLTEHPDVSVGSPVELWGRHLPVERIAAAAGTIPYELMCQISERVLRD